MNPFIRVCSVADVPANRGRPAFADGRLVALFKVDGEICALDDSCPHGGASLAGGRFDGRTVTCPGHGLRFDVRTGRIPGVDGLRATTYPVQILDGEVLVATESGAALSAVATASAACASVELRPRSDQCATE